MFNDDENKPFLQYDELGFIIGLKQTGRDISKIDKTTEEIRDILLGFQKNLEQSLLSKYSVPKPKLSALEQALIDAQIKPVDSDDLLKEMANPIIQATLTLDKVAKTLDDLIEESIPELKRNRSQNLLQRQAVELDSPESVIREFSNRGNEQSRDNSTAVNQQTETTRAVGQSGPKPGASAEQIDPIPVQRERDSKGRFIGGASESKSTLGKIAQTIGTVIKGSISGPQGVDPTVDAINEVATVLSPVKRAAGFVLRPLTGLMKSRKRNEPLPKEQSEHNKKQVKLLQRIADNLQSKGGLLGGIGKLIGAGGGILGGLLGKGAKGLGKILKFGKGLPVVGALLTAMSFADWDKKTTKEKGSTVGSTAGGILGGAVGSLLGPVGTIAGAAIGSWIGDKLGGVVAPYVKEWTDSLINADIPSVIKKGWDGFIDLVSKAFNVSPVGAAIEAGKSAVDWIKEKVSGGKFNPSDLLRKQYGGSGVNESKPVQFGGAARVQDVKSLDGKPLNVAVYDAYRKQGLSHHQALAITGEVGRENDFDAKTIFGKHIDPAKDGKGQSITNMGMLSWNRERADALQAHLKKRGVLDEKGNMIKGQAALDAQAEFAVSEMKSGKYKNRLSHFWNNPDANPESFAKELGKDYVGWAYGQKTIKGKNGTRVPFDHQSHSAKVNGYVAKTANDVQKKQAVTSYAQNTEMPKGADALAKFAQNTEMPTVKSAITNQAETIIQKAKPAVSMLSTQPAVTPVAARSNSLAASYTPPKLETKIEPAKEYFTSPAPQEVIVKNQNSGTINQNVSNRILAHAITGGLGMGVKWNG